MDKFEKLHYLKKFKEFMATQVESKTYSTKEPWFLSPKELSQLPPLIREDIKRKNCAMREVINKFL
jgi:hypothetical protein